MNKVFDVLAIGNALVDISAQVTIQAYNTIAAIVPMQYGKYNPVNSKTADKILSLLIKPVENAAGSAANTMIGLASFGGSAGFQGRVGQDQHAYTFEHDMRLNSVFPHLVYDHQGQTGRCIIMVTPDGERTMNTHLGSAPGFGPLDVDAAIIDSAKVLLLEGYMLESPSATQAFNRAARFAHAAGTKIALSLSSEYCIQSGRDEMLALAHAEHGIVFANKGESIAFSGKATFEEAVPVIASLFGTAALTCGSKGAVIAHEGKIIEIPAEKISKLVDTTGAGDQFAAGFLYGYTHGMSMEHCGKLGAMAAAEVIQHVGPRPQQRYVNLIKNLG